MGGASVMSFPDTPEEALSLTLREHGYDGLQFTFRPLPGGSTSDITLAESVGEIPPGLPARFIIKRQIRSEPPADPNDGGKFSEREIGFYKHLSADVGTQAPSYFGSFEDEKTGSSALVLEFVEGTPGSVIEGTTPERLASIVEIMARQHGKYWNNVPRFDFGPPTWLDRAATTGSVAFLKNLIPMYAEKPGPFSPTALEAMARAWGEHNEETLNFFANKPATLVHGDCELDNVVFSDRGPVMLDWQLITVAYPGHDLAVLIGTAWTDQIEQIVPDLIQMYCTVFAENGGPRWTDNDVLDEIAAGSLFWAGGLGAATFGGMVNADRLAAMLSGFAEMLDSLPLVERWETHYS